MLTLLPAFLECVDLIGKRSLNEECVLNLFILLSVWGLLRNQAGRYILINFQNVAEGIIILLFLFEVTINLVRKST